MNFTNILSTPADQRTDDRALQLRTAAIAALLAVCIGSVTALYGGPVAILFFGLVAALTVAFADYRASILIAVILLPLSASRLVPRELLGITGLNPLNASLLLATFWILFISLFQQNRVSLPRLPLPFTIYVAILGLAALYGSQFVHQIPPSFRMYELINFDNAVGYLRDVLLKPSLILVTAYLLATIVRNSRRPQLWLIPVLGSMMVMPLFVLAYLAVSANSLTMLASSQARGVLSITGMHANELGLMFNMTLALVLFTMFGTKGRTRWLLMVLTGILVAAVLLTFSRGAFLGLVVLALYFMYTQRRFKVLLLSVVVMPLALLLLPQAVVDRATTGVQNRSVEAITAGRVDRIWRPLLPEVAENPLLGSGLSSILWSEPVRNGSSLRVGHPHNAYLGVLLDFGVLGGALIAWFFLHMARLFRELRASHQEPLWRGFFLGGSACILILMVQGLTDDRFTPTYSQTSLWMAYGFALGLASRMKQGA